MYFKALNAKLSSWIGIAALVFTALSPAQATVVISDCKHKLAAWPSWTSSMVRIVTYPLDPKSFDYHMATGFYLGNGIVLTSAGAINPYKMDLKEIHPDDISVNFDLIPGVGQFDARSGVSAMSGDDGVFFEMLDRNHRVGEILSDESTDKNTDPGKIHPVFLKIQKPWPEIKTPLALEDPGIRVGDDIFVLGFSRVNGHSFGSSLQQQVGKILKIEGNVLTISVEIKEGFVGGPIVHLASGKIIALTHSLKESVNIKLADETITRTAFTEGDLLFRMSNLKSLQVSQTSQKKSWLSYLSAYFR